MGLQDFLKHIYAYFDVTPSPTTAPSSTRTSEAPPLDEYVPVFRNGVLESYVARPQQVLNVPTANTGLQVTGTPSVPPSTIGSAETNSYVQKAAPVFYVKSSDGQFLPVDPPLHYMGANHIFGPQSQVLPNPSPLAVGSVPQPSPMSTFPVNPKPLQVQEVKGRTIKNEAEWDGWPDGEFERDFTWKEFADAAELRSHWAVSTGCGDRKGNEHAETWEGGKRLTRSCLGIISCSNPVCSIIIRPHVKAFRMNAQLCAPCQCGAVLQHEKCDVRSILWKWSGGVHYSNGGYHLHQRPTHLLHILPKELRQFEEIVRSNPRAGPLQLVVGAQGIDGPGKSVADISPVFMNQHRVGKERLKIQQGEVQTGDALIAAFADFDKKCPGFVIHSTFGAETVISVQSDFMRSQLVKNMELEEQVNGIVSDAAHGWWKVRESILIVSSTYCSVLLCWVPGVLSYSNGSSALHFMYHFIALFQSIAHEAESRNIEVVDQLFAGVMDFSQAERLGYIKAFIHFWITRPGNTRLNGKLEQAAEKLLKGCREHFRAGVTRICRMTGVIPPNLVDDFRLRALGLVHCKDSETFIEQCALLVQDFPKIRDWMEWWARPSHASMLFESERVMDIELWNSIPDTTNAEESMHWKLYCMANRDHAFLNGMYSLHTVATHFQRQFDAKLQGIPVRYGRDEPWKAKAEKFGFTKPSRHQDNKGKKNDGRPPDTAKELLGSSPKKEPPRKMISTSIFPERIPCFPWKGNSCWLDTSLQILHVVFEHLSGDLDPIIKRLPAKSLLRSVFATYTARQKLSDEDPNISKSLGHIRDNFRTLLKKRLIIKNVTDFESLTTWFHEIVTKEYLVTVKKSTRSYRAPSAFETLHVSLSKCSGTERIGGPHIQISKTPRRQRFMQLRETEHALYKGSITRYFSSFASILKPPSSDAHCWRVKEGKLLCTGERHDHINLLVSIPLLFSMEVNAYLDWDIPAVLMPDSDDLAKEDGVIYDLVALALTSEDGTHFIARFYQNGRVYTYDGMKNQGYAVRDTEATFQTHMWGKNIVLPVGFRIYELYYVLHGGIDAQDAFFTQRAVDLKEQLNIQVERNNTDAFPTLSYHADGFAPMKPKYRYWHSQPEKAHTLEYLTVNSDTKTSAVTQPPGPDEGIPLTPPADVVDLVSDSEKSVGGDKDSRLTHPASIPDPARKLDCRCGVFGDANKDHDREISGMIIQCKKCLYWLHVACQRNGWASHLEVKTPFICDDCNVDEVKVRFGQKRVTARKSNRKEIEERTRKGRPLAERLWAGRGALARHGKFWYPVTGSFQLNHKL